MGIGGPKSYNIPYPKWGNFSYQSLGGEKLYDAFRGGLEKHKWSEVNRVLLDLTPTVWSAHDAAVKFSRNLTMRMTNKLSENPAVTAEALCSMTGRCAPSSLRL